jgi:hypothetical protein
MRWNRFEQRQFTICNCRPASVQLIELGFFPSAPARPSAAFDVNLLDLIILQCHNSAPNITAWSQALEGFWAERQYYLSPEGSSRRRLGSALLWFQILRQRITAATSAVISGSPASFYDVSSDVHEQDSDDGSDGGLKPDLSENDSPDTTPLDEPTDYLQACCPLCFGITKPSFNRSDSDVLCCIDANFAQKRRKSKHTDPQLQYPNTRFVDPALVSSMEESLNQARNAKPKRKQKGKVPDIDAILPVSSEVLDDCEQAFIAAQANIIKTSKNNYSDTGLMAMVCRHDRVLWVVNMTTPGERQHYALVLIQQLFKNLPFDWRVGLLYDIACQLSRSMLKYDLLPEYRS